MKLIVIIVVFLSQVLSIDLILPFQGDENDFNILKAQSEMKLEDGSVTVCQMAKYESNKSEPINRIVVGRIEIFNNTARTRPDFKRWVYHSKANDKEFILICSNNKMLEIEDCYIVINNILHNLFDINRGVEAIFGGYSQQSIKIKRMLYDIIPFILNQDSFQNVFVGIEEVDFSQLPLTGRHIYIDQDQLQRPSDISVDDWREAGPS